MQQRVFVTDVCGHTDNVTNYDPIYVKFVFINKIFHVPPHMEIKGVEVQWLWWPNLQIHKAKPTTRKKLYTEWYVGGAPSC